MTHKRTELSSRVKLRVMKRDRFRCTYCGVAGTDAELEIDHIIAVARGGSHNMSNLTTACRACNQTKGANPAKSVQAAPVPVNGIIGLYLITLDERDEMVWQGRISRRDGDVVLVQLFSHLSGEPTNVQGMHIATVLSPKCRLYESRDDWFNDYEKLTIRSMQRLKREAQSERAA